MSNSNLNSKNLLAAVNLVEELDNKAAETISGGENVGTTSAALVAQPTEIRVNNTTALPLYIDMNYGKYYPDVRIESGTYHWFTSSAQIASIDFDSNYCEPGIQVKSYTLDPGKKYDLSLVSDCDLELYDAGYIA